MLNTTQFYFIDLDLETQYPTKAKVLGKLVSKQLSIILDNDVKGRNSYYPV